jgi:hypothetical protein
MNIWYYHLLSSRFEIFNLGVLVVLISQGLDL